MFSISLLKALAKESEKKESPKIKDQDTGEMVVVVSPSNFQLVTVMLDTGYYLCHKREYRFRLSEARQVGLKIAK